MEAIQNLIQIDYWTVFWGFIAILFAFKFLSSLFEWFINKFGIETKSQRQKREDHDLLIQTSRNLALLQERHTQDEQEFRNNLNNYMKESREDRKALHDEMSKFSENRIHDREQSLAIQKELTDSIKGIVEGQRDKDDKIEDLTKMVLDKQISDYRWEIINLADKISNGKLVSKECFKHAIATHTKYEDIIDRHGLTNGEVEISMEIINEAYKQMMSEGF